MFISWFSSYFYFLPNLLPTCFPNPHRKKNDIRNFMYTKHNGDNSKLRVFSFIPQRQRIQPNFMNRLWETTTNTTNTQTHKHNPNN